MVWIQGDLQCPKCKKVSHTKPAAQATNQKKGQPDYLYISEKKGEGSVKVQRECPQCRNTEAFHWVSGISGEHAGIGRERTVDHYRCTKCSFTWAES